MVKELGILDKLSRIEKQLKDNDRLDFLMVTVLIVVLMVGGSFIYKGYEKLTNTIDEYIISVEPDVLASDLPHEKLGSFTLTFYCPCEKCVGKKKIVRTATGTTPKANRTIAVDTSVIPLGSILYIEGYGYFIAEDTGSAVKGRRIDVFVNNHKEALQNGKRIANVYLLKRGY